MEYQKSEVKTETILEGYTFVSKLFLDTLKEEYNFIGSEKWVEASIYGRVRFFAPDTIDNTFCHFAIERKKVNDKTFDRVWFAPVISEVLVTIPLEEVVKAWCVLKQINILCPIAAKILNSTIENKGD